MPVSTRSQLLVNSHIRSLQRNAAAKVARKSIIAPRSQPLRRSTRIAKLNWLKRLRPRLQQQEQPQVIKPVRVKRQLAPSKPAAALPPAEETFTMMANPMFFTTAPRSCTGWSCCCAAPHGFGPGRTNWCALYSLEPMPEEPDPFVFPPTAAKTPPLSDLLSLLPPLPNSPVTPRPAPASPTPALSERTMNMVLAQVGVPVKPQSPNTDCMTQ